MSHTARFAVDPRLARLLGATYRSTELAIKELVDNAWDADAVEVTIQLPGELSSDPINVSDNGTGMTEAELRTEYLKVARDRRSVRGDRTPRKQRQVRDRKVIGRFSGLMIADEMKVNSRARRRWSTLTLDLAKIRESTSDFEAIEIPFSSVDCGSDEHGTTIVLSHLNRRLAHPNPEKLRRILVLDYGRATDFRIVVNGQAATFRDIPGEAYEVAEDVPHAGRVHTAFAIANDKQAVKHPGIVLKVGGKPIGEPASSD